MLKFEPVCISCSKEILGCLGQTIACYMFGAVNGASFALPTTVNSEVQKYRLVGSMSHFILAGVLFTNFC